jgi:hypothetical protein
MADKPLTWNQIKNWWPIFGAIISITVYLVANFVDIRGNQQEIETKIDALIAIENRNSEDLKSWQTGVLSRIGKHDLAISLLNHEVGIR